jgi:hypothetical protein
MSDAPLLLLDVIVKAGAGVELRFDGLDATTTTVATVKQLVEDRTGTFVRRQKLILRGKVLSDDQAVLATVAGGGAAAKTTITMMLLAVPGGGGAGGGGAASPGNQTRGAAAAKAAAAAAAEARLKRAREGGGGAGGAASEVPPPTRQPIVVTWQARRDTWGKTGVIAYREAGASEGLDREAAEWAAASGGGRGGNSNGNGAAAAAAASAATPVDNDNHSNPRHAQLFAGLVPVANPRAMDLSGNPLLKRLPRAVFAPPSLLRRQLQTLRLVGCGLTTEGVPWASLPPGLTCLALDRNAIGPLVPRALSEQQEEEEGEEVEEEGQGAAAVAAKRRARRRPKFARLAVLTLSHNRIARLEPGALMFARSGGSDGGGSDGGGGGGGGGGDAGGAAAATTATATTTPLAPLPSLRALDLSHNCLETLPWDDMAAGALASVVELDCRHNRVRALEPPPPPAAASSASAPAAAPFSNPLSRRMPALRSLRLDSNMVRGPLPASLFGGGNGGGGGGGGGTGGGNGGGATGSSSSSKAEAAAPLPPSSFCSAVPCPSLSVMTLDDNPITAQEMRQAEGWDAFDARRVRNATKRIESGALLGRATFSEGADAADWERYK